MRPYKFKILAVLLISAFLFTTCQKVPISGRRQLHLLPESTMTSMSLTSYQDFLKQNPPSKDMANTMKVKTVGNNIAKAVTQFLKSKNQEKRIKGYKWEFNLVDDNSVNAWAMPGGKVVVYKGILPLTANDAGLAVVMGHEIAHIVARHGNERMSQGLVLQLGGMALDVAMKEKPEVTQAIFAQAYGIGSQVGVALPFSRKHEYEADKLGLVFMAMAGYNPEEAIRFWEKMAKQGGSSTPEFMSTHPSDEKRIAELKAFLPEAKKYYKK